MASERNPYVGPSPFAESESHLFFGRENEAWELLALIMAYPVTLFYSQSGAGKTSLINARILPKLRARQANIFGVARAGLELAKGVTLDEKQNVFLSNTLLGLKPAGVQAGPEEIEGVTLKDYLKRLPRRTAPEGFYPFQVIIFDQFEEVFTSFPDRWRDLEGFFCAVSDALADDPLLRIVFVMREEHIASLDPYAAMLPHRLQRRFRLERLRKNAALVAVEKPAEQEGRKYKPGAAEKLVDNLLKVPIKSLDGTVIDASSEFVEPVHLQVVCERLWDSLDDGVLEIDENRIAKYGDVDEALANYYNDSLKEVVADGSVNEGMLRDWFEIDLITPIGTRGTVYVDETGASGLKLPTVQKLEKRRLIRQDLRAGAAWYELTHDRFIGPIRSSNRLWRQTYGKGKVSAADLERRAREWARDGRPSLRLLSGREIKKVRAWRRDVGTRRESDLLREFVDESESGARKKTVWRLSITALLFAAVAAYGIYSFMAVRRQRARADKAEQFERSRIAGDYARTPGNEYVALALGLEAIGTFQPKDLHPAASDGLRMALELIGNRTPLRECAAVPFYLSFSADGSLLLADCSGKIHVWEAATGAHRYNLPVRGTALWRQVDFSPDGTMLYAISYPPQPEPASFVNEDADDASAEADGNYEVFILKASSGMPERALQETLRGIYGLRMSGDGQRILGVAPTDPRLRLCERGGGRADNLLPPEHRRGIRQADISRNGTHLIILRRSGEVELWDVSRLGETPQTPLSTFTDGTPPGAEVVSLIKFSLDGKFGMTVSVIRGTGGAVTTVWDEQSLQSVAAFRSEVGKSVQHASFSADGQQIVIVGSEKAEVRAATTGDLLYSRPLPQGSAVRFHGADVLIAREAEGKATLLRWEALSGKLTPLVEAVEGKLKAAAISPDGKRVAATDENGITQIWDLQDTPNIADLSLAELRARACTKLRPQEEYKQVKALCGQ